MRIVIFGPQGVGKGTQAALLCQSLGIPHISTGDLFRHHISNKTELGNKVHGYLSTGELVPDEVTNAMVQQRLSDQDTRTGYLLDGFPRTQEQAHWLADNLPDGQQPELGIVLTAPEEELIERLLLRGREDDTRPVIQRRLQVYRTDTKPLLDYYRPLLTEIDGTGTVDDVHHRIINSLPAA